MSRGLHGQSAPSCKSAELDGDRDRAHTERSGRKAMSVEVFGISPNFLAFEVDADEARAEAETPD